MVIMIMVIVNSDDFLMLMMTTMMSDDSNQGSDNIVTYFQHINNNFQFLYRHVLAASSAFVSLMVN